MIYKENSDEPVIVEHTTVNPVVERTTVIERDSWWSEPWAIALALGAIALIGLFAYWALYNPNTTTPTVVENTTIDRTMPDQRAQVIAPAANPVIVTTPAPAPTVNVTTPAAQPPVVIDNRTSTPAPAPAPNNNGSDTSTNPGSSDTNSGSGQ